jgi:hypothetical protein
VRPEKYYVRWLDQVSAVSVKRLGTLPVQCAEGLRSSLIPVNGSQGDGRGITTTERHLGPPELNRLGAKRH